MNKNRIFGGLIWALCAVLFVSCIKPEGPSEPPQPTVSPENTELHDFYTIADDETNLAALLFLGTDETFDAAKTLLQEKYFSSLPNQWPETVETVEAQPWEIYLLLPKYKDTVLTVYERNMESLEDEQASLLTERLVTSNPVLLRCNFSDIFPSVEVKIELGGETAVCVPSISLKDGAVAAGERIYTEDVLQQTPDSSLDHANVDLAKEVFLSARNTLSSPKKKSLKFARLLPK